MEHRHHQLHQGTHLLAVRAPQMLDLGSVRPRKETGMSQTTPPSSQTGDPAIGQETVDRALEGQARAPIAGPGRIGGNRIRYHVFHARQLQREPDRRPRRRHRHPGGAFLRWPNADHRRSSRSIPWQCVRSGRIRHVGTVLGDLWSPPYALYNLNSARCCQEALALFLAMFAILSFFFFVASLRKIRTSFRHSGSRRPLSPGRCLPR